jgi:hypothetical protein
MKICTIVETRTEVINHYKKKFNDSKLNNSAPKTYLYNGACSRIENILLREL